MNITLNEQLNYYFNQAMKLIEPNLSQVMSDSGMVERDEQKTEQAERKEWENQVHSLLKNIKNIFVDSLVPKFWKY